MIISFTSKETPILSQVGGKAQSLISTTQAGLPVPEGLALTVEFFQPWTDQVKATPAWQTLLGHPTKENCDKVKAIAEKLCLTERQKSQLDQAMLELDGIEVFAVRSSSPEEDLAGSSFAGIYETFLGTARGRLEETIARAYSSMFDFRVMAYKTQNAINLEGTCISVIIQKQIASEVSGVAFSLNPLNNCYDEVMINSSFGLGEAIVSGRVTPDIFVVDKVTHAIVHKKLASKDYVLVSSKAGGVAELKLDDPTKPSLTDAQAVEVSQLATQVEAHYRMPMDIEWAYADGRLYLLQARPITTYVPLPDIMITRPGAEKYLYLDLIVLSQGFDESLSVMGNQIWGQMLEAIKADIGLFDRGMDGAVLNIEGRQYVHLSNVMKGLGMRAATSIWKTYDKPTRKTIESIDLSVYLPAQTPEPLRGLTWRTLKYAGRAMGAALRGLLNPDNVEKAYVEMVKDDIAQSKQLAIQDIPFRNLVDQLIDRFARQMDASIAIMLPAMLALPRLQRMFKKDGVDDLLLALQMALNGNPTSEMGHLMFELAKFPEVQETETGEQFAQKLAHHAVSPEFQKAFDVYMSRFGCRTIREIDIATQRPYENLPAFFQQLKAMDIHSDLLATVAQRRENAYGKLLALARQKGKEKQFRQQAHLQDNSGYREAPKYFFIITVDLMRQRALSLGKAFVAQGRLDDPAQVFDLTVDQLTAAQIDRSLDIRALAIHNMAPRAKQTKVQNWPQIIDSRGKIFRAVRTAVNEGELIGDPIAPGVVRGIANILHDPYEKPLKKGEILITRSTDPGWTPLFMNAGGVVLEVGGALQHGAIIAREYGLPCVSGINGATMSIPDGALIEVDGTNGIVKILERANVM